jgi:hypothetical protein
MAFLEDPTETLPDPDGLLAQWRKYEEIALELVEDGQLVPDSERCGLSLPVRTPARQAKAV